MQDLPLVPAYIISEGSVSLVPFYFEANKKILSCPISCKYKIRDNSKIYCVTFTVVYWIDLFIRDGYRAVFINRLKYCQEHKGLKVYAYCIMPTHIHLICGSNGDSSQSDIIRDLKSYTSRNIRKLLEDHTIPESRRECPPACRLGCYGCLARRFRQRFFLCFRESEYYEVL